MAENNTRTENDFIGSLEVPIDALFGIHSLRAIANFPDTTLFHEEWFKAIALVKKACYLTARDFFSKIKERGELDKLKTAHVDENKLEALILASEEMEQGKWFEHFITPAISGGAGTSINLNINEILANRALQLIGHKPGEYQIIDPIEQANIFQSTNDVIPTSLKLAIIQLLNGLEESINKLRQQIEQLEKEHQYHVRKGFTQMQEAVPTSFGRLFSTYSEALSRDWWRISKCFERIKVVNLGGSAIGSGITVPRYFIMEVVRKLQEITNLPVTRGENLYDATNNLDSVVEVHGILKSLAVNFEKMVSDIRLLSSDIRGNNEMSIPQKQVGSSIMPGKVNPVIPEFVVSLAHKVYANDMLISSLSAQGCLELNAYLPTIGHAVIESIKLLTASADTLKVNLFDGIEIHHQQAEINLLQSPSITTALVPYIGYNQAADLAREMKESNRSIFELNKELNFMSAKKLEEILKPENLLKEGFTLKDLIDD